MKDINKKDLRPVNGGLIYDTKQLTVEDGLRRQVRELKSRIVILETKTTRDTAIEKVIKNLMSGNSVKNTSQVIGSVIPPNSGKIKKEMRKIRARIANLDDKEKILELETSLAECFSIMEEFAKVATEKFSQIKELTAENKAQAKTIRELEAHSDVLTDCIC